MWEQCFESEQYFLSQYMVSLVNLPPKAFFVAKTDFYLDNRSASDWLHSEEKYWHFFPLRKERLRKNFWEKDKYHKHYKFIPVFDSLQDSYFIMYWRSIDTSKCFKLKRLFLLLKAKMFLFIKKTQKCFKKMFWLLKAKRFLFIQTPPESGENSPVSEQNKFFHAILKIKGKLIYAHFLN